jgi:DNA recombination protein RmuC
MASATLPPGGQSAIRIWNRELATYPERDARRMHLLLVVLITVTLYYELYVGSGVATIMLAQLKIPFPIFVYILAGPRSLPPRMRGAWGEVSLGNLLDQVLTVDQYERNVEVKPGSNQRVEYAIKLPGGDDGDAPLWLPIDAKFPNEDYERLVDASDCGDVEAVEAASKAVEMRIRTSAKDICEKYVHPPHSTDFAVLFLPTEGLFAEIIRRPGLVDALQREYRIVVTGPTTLMALLNSLRMGFRTLAIQKRSSEVWQVLGAVKTEFGKYGEILDKVQQKLHEASNTIDKVSVRRRAIDRRLRGVEILPEMEAGAILSLPGGNGFDAEDSADADSPAH